MLVAFALQLAEDKCHRAGSLLEATCTTATSAALCPWNKPLAVPSARSRCLAPQHHRVKRGMLRPGGGSLASGAGWGRGRSDSPQPPAAGSASPQLPSLRGRVPP